MARFVCKDYFDFVFDGEHYGIAGDLSASAYLYRVDARHGNALATIGVADDETFVVAAYGYTVGIDDKLHRVMIICEEVVTNMARIPDIAVMG